MAIYLIAGKVYQSLQMKSEQKITANKTGTLFYTKISQSNPRYRVRFRSFKQSQFVNHQIQDQLEQIQTSYNFFKYGDNQNKKGSLHIAHKQSSQKLYKNMKDRLKDSESLKIRLKTMKDTRKSIFQKIKSIKE